MGIIAAIYLLSERFWRPAHRILGRDMFGEETMRGGIVAGRYFLTADPIDLGGHLVCRH